MKDNYNCGTLEDHVDIWVRLPATTKLARLDTWG